MRPLPPPTLGNLNPPPRGYRYFDHAGRGFDPASGLDDARNRWILSECALLAYDSEAVIHQAFAGWAQEVEPLPAPEAGFCYRVELDGRDALLAFRGTQVFNPGDSLSKFRAIAANHFTNSRFAPRPRADGCRVHGGFADSANQLLDLMQARGLAQRPRRWWLCGHSLGGALAVFAAEALHALPGHSVGGVITFGQPRVGDRRHAEALAALPFPILRVVHGCDVVPAVPPERIGFVHAGREHVFLPERRASYPATVVANVLGLWQRLRHGIGALSPVALQDHSPLFYATHCYNEFEPDPP